MDRIERPAGSSRTESELSGKGDGLPLKWHTPQELIGRFVDGDPDRQRQIDEARVWVRKHFGLNA